MRLLKRFQNSKGTVPVLLLLLTILAYGLLIPDLGFYFDDWPVIYMIQSGADFWEFYQYDRPFSAWTYVITAPILGTSPFLWHTFTLLLRWLTSWLLWWVLKLIWPNHKKEATWVALLFSVHPAFLQQSIAVAYSQHFITYVLFFLSCGTMLAAAQKPRRAWLLSGISIVSAILHIFTMEYFWGLELIRPLLLWIAFSNRDGLKKDGFKKTILNWLPYLAVLSSAIVWRVVFYSQRFETDGDPNSLRLLTLLKTKPLEGIIHLIEMAVRDLVILIVTVWSETIQPDLINTNRIILISWVLVAFSIILLQFYRKWIETPGGDIPTMVEPTWIKQAVLLGITVFVVGTTPVWMTDKYISVGMYSDRFALAAMWGTAILLVGLFSWIGIHREPRSIILSILIGLSIGTHFRTSNNYRWDWTNQQRFFWQLYWRAPELEPETPIFSDGTIFSFAGDYPTAFAINTFYGSNDSSAELPYWFIELDSGFHSDPISYLNGYNLSKSLRNYSFRGNSLESIVLYYAPEGGSCLWLLDDSDDINMSIPGLTWEALPLSDLNRINTKGQPENLSFQTIFGKEPEHQWCYYFQKADAAQQEGDWDAIIQIYNEVNQLGYDPNNKLEWIPFVVAYAQVDMWDDAKDITLSAYESSPVTRKTFCALWGSFNTSNIETDLNQNVITDVITSLGCQ